ncbi:2-C-methyl-D-erythritol 4-phosphate cytidylyltransferase [Paraconexibacter antarcticus]|uniref:2-C-methyl-D-erythritol 4-phosphate cytidylyltransferase n=1 Tax=Paraconexibacter antarcticus TaxID=2949664 RepID=A0ABY5DXV9_9ACTN|nr:2-C-methyl-D-erythritol 4-phosphate cytidylyltransferase [Paraconexibacter antarcticus]UTI66521.1 2-C-methyl-D-erythritol 4-phosphate cytidylyltransferase [Paraconexibacter antarcticus]
MGPVALIVAAGRGERLGSDGPKAFVRCGGRPMLEWSVDAFRAAGVERIVVALPAGYEAPAGCIGVSGGAERSHSVRAALGAAGDPAVVLVHDAARPLVTAQIVEDCLAALTAEVDAVIAAAAVTDTLKEADGHDVVRTLDRSRLWAVQTPQVFWTAALAGVMAQDDAVLAAATDDASLIEAGGGRVRVVPCPRDNFKVTTPEDLRLAELVLADRARPAAGAAGPG